MADQLPLATVPADGNATLVLALAGANSAALDTYMNDDSTPFVHLTPSVSGGNALIREGVHAKYAVHNVSIPVFLLRQGPNTISLVQTRSTGPSEHLMYDYLSLELP